MNSVTNPGELPCYANCDAPLCPLEYANNSQWFPDEDICKLRSYKQLSWIRTQRKIKRLLLQGRISGDETCFTVPMLQAVKAVRRPRGMRPEDMYRNVGGRPSTPRQFRADLPDNGLRKGDGSNHTTDSSSSNFRVKNQGLLIKKGD